MFYAYIKSIITTNNDINIRANKNTGIIPNHAIAELIELFFASLTLLVSLDIDALRFASIVSCSFDEDSDILYNSLRLNFRLSSLSSYLLIQFRYGWNDKGSLSMSLTKISISDLNTSGT